MLFFFVSLTASAQLELEDKINSGFPSLTHFKIKKYIFIMVALQL